MTKIKVVETPEGDEEIVTPAIEDLGISDEWKRLVPPKLLERYEVHNFRRAAEILSTGFRDQFDELCDVLAMVEIPVEWVTEAGGNESRIPKHFSTLLRPKGWHETRITADLHVHRTTVRRVPDLYQTPAARRGAPKLATDGSPRYKSVKEVNSDKPIEGYVDAHKIDYVKDGVAFDLEWNSKDQTFDRDIFAMRTFFDCQVVEVGIIVTRSKDLNEVFESLGPDVKGKYGASTTWMGKLLYRLKSGRMGGCPVLAIGIKPDVISNWKRPT
jgi:CRISPR-associated protein Csd2